MTSKQSFSNLMGNKDDTWIKSALTHLIKLNFDITHLSRNSNDIFHTHYLIHNISSPFPCVQGIHRKPDIGKQAKTCIQCTLFLQMAILHVVTLFGRVQQPALGNLKRKHISAPSIGFRTMLQYTWYCGASIL